MREFNKIFVIALPRCATVSMCDALGILGVPTAHLGRIYGETSVGHHDPGRLIRIHEQIAAGDYDLDVLRYCRGLVDYPACCFEVFSQLDKHFPGSLFVNIRRDNDLPRWIQSVERQFVGLQLINHGRESTDEQRRFMQAVLAFRAMTFGQSQFDAQVYVRSYAQYQQRVAEFFANRKSDLLEIACVSELTEHGFDLLGDFLDCPTSQQPFPKNNDHSSLPHQAFMQALAQGRITSQTGIARDLPTGASEHPLPQ
jgi:hypothetical protein